MNREAIDAALFARLDTLVAFTTRSRKLKHWDDVGKEEQPALFMAKEDEQLTTDSGLPTAMKLNTTLWIYVRVDEVAPGTAINPLLDAVQDLLNARHPINGRNQLQLSDVAYCRIEGTIQVDEGTLDGQAVVKVPVVIFTTS